VQLLGYRLPKGAREYVPMKPRKGRYVSRRLGLELRLEDGRLRFYDGPDVLLDAEEMSAHWELLAQREQQRADGESRLRRKAQRKAAEAERRAAELQAELERLKRGRP
jgi:regulator of protease activity HflC (stomatin/prohibitin superfamily)